MKIRSEVRKICKISTHGQLERMSSVSQGYVESDLKKVERETNEKQRWKE